MTDCPTICDIPEGGWCYRHNIRKTAHWVQLCQHNPQYFAAWETGRGPGQVTTPHLPRAKQAGAGTELKAILHRFGIHEQSCNCSNHAKVMDNRGPQWCRDNIETIIGWLVFEAKKRHLPAPRKLARLLILSAIRRAVRKQAEQ